MLVDECPHPPFSGRVQKTKADSGIVGTYPIARIPVGTKAQNHCGK
jgi:hypothetical protein